MAFQDVKSIGRTEGTQAEKFKFAEPGDTLEGYLVEKGAISMDDKDISRYVVQTNTGNASFLGSFKLDELLEKVEIGFRIRVTYKGKERTKSKRTVSLYTVEVDMEDRLSTAA